MSRISLVSLLVLVSTIVITAALSLYDISRWISQRFTWRKTQRFHANWVGVKNPKHQERDSQSSEYNASVISSRFVSMYFKCICIRVLLHLSNVQLLFRISHILVYLCTYICQIDKHYCNASIIISKNHCFGFFL